VLFQTLPVCYTALQGKKAIVSDLNKASASKFFLKSRESWMMDDKQEERGQGESKTTETRRANIENKTESKKAASKYKVRDNRNDAGEPEIGGPELG
jgi:hypothetical protein